jgi:hypothetical protein
MQHIKDLEQNNRFFSKKREKDVPPLRIWVVYSNILTKEVLLMKKNVEISQFYYEVARVSAGVMMTPEQFIEKMLAKVYEEADQAFHMMIHLRMLSLDSPDAPELHEGEYMVMVDDLDEFFAIIEEDQNKKKEE